MRNQKVKKSEDATFAVLDFTVGDLAPDAEIARAKSTKRIQLEAIEIENFKAIKKTKIPLASVTILVGPNGCGKSSVLQAVHWAARAASYISPKNGSEVVSFERLDYLPSSRPLLTGHKVPLVSKTSTPPTRVAFIQPGLEEVPTESNNSKDPSTSSGGLTAAISLERPTTTVKIWAARNHGIAVHISGGSTVTAYKQRTAPITAYIPGLAGLAEKETILAQPLLRRQAASGDAGGVLRNVLFNIASRQQNENDNSAALKRVERLNQLIQSVHPDLSVKVSYDDREDVHINATFSDLNASRRPLESAATGVLQVVQIFAYLILFKPRILLVDEPDAHLHPDKQERLIESLEAAALEFDTQIVLTTHSQHVVRAASSAAKLVWMQDGDVVSEDHAPIRTLMGWGAMDKKLLMFVEDEDDQAVRAILRQWPELYRQLAICRCFGVENLPKDALLTGLTEAGNVNVKAVIHRDGDFMTDAERRQWTSGYKSKNVYAWVTKHVDVEAYFCESTYLQAAYDVDSETAEAWRTAASQQVKKAYEKFESKRAEVNRQLYTLAGGGQPNTQTLWKELGEQGPNTVLGKSLLAQLKCVVVAAGRSASALNSYFIPDTVVLAPDLKAVIEKALAAKTVVA
jgi:ABC-type cobalamin/Fe3+-siderophores transport system ATPase subunit